MKIGIIGNGAWGTALAFTASRANRKVVLWGRRDAGQSSLSHLIMTNKESALESCGLILLAVPAQTLRGVVQEFQPIIAADAALVIAAKGIEQSTGKTLSSMLAEIAPSHKFAVLSGPNFASEITAGKPAAAAIASLDPGLGKEICHQLAHSAFRPYYSDDVIGVEIAGAVKNVIAIACGIVVGRGLGENARAALMTRGLAEITRLAIKLGGRLETMMGLSGMGDLALTCSSQQSRNYSFGIKLGQGIKAADILAEKDLLIEGYATAPAVLALAAQANVEMPISTAVAAILSQQISIDAAVEQLLLRPLKHEAF